MAGRSPRAFHLIPNPFSLFLRKLLRNEVIDVLAKVFLKGFPEFMGLLVVAEFVIEIGGEAPILRGVEERAYFFEGLGVVAAELSGLYEFFEAFALVSAAIEVGEAGLRSVVKELVAFGEHLRDSHSFGDQF